MSKGYYKTEQILVDTKSHDEYVYHDNGEVLYESHFIEPVYEEKQVWVEYTEQELLEQEMSQCENWFANIYTYQEQKYRRLIALNIPDDDGVSAEQKLLELYNEAEIKRKRIQELEKLI